MPRFTLITAGTGMAALLLSAFLASSLEAAQISAIIFWAGSSLFFVSFLTVGVVTLIKRDSIFTNAARQWGLRFFSHKIWAQVEGVMIITFMIVGAVLSMVALISSMFDWIS
jgi:hypothetical protein